MGTAQVLKELSVGRTYEERQVLDLKNKATMKHKSSSINT